MFRITEDLSSGSFVQYLAKVTRMVLSCSLTWKWSVLWQHIVTIVTYSPSRKALFLDSELHTHTHTHTHIGLQYAAITPTTSMSTNTIEPLL